MRIFIAEDDEALARFVRQGLEGEHYSVDVLPDGEQARIAATEFEYDVVILDLNLPKLDGVSVLRHLRSKRPSLPVLVLTQRSRVEDRVQCLDTGADDYIPKHLSPNSLDILHIGQDLVAKIGAVARLRTFHPDDVLSRKFPPPSHSASRDRIFLTAPVMVASGISTSGPKALEEISPLFPRELSVPFLVVQHLLPRTARTTGQPACAQSLCARHLTENSFSQVWSRSLRLECT
jgi:CheY-like chemotaxis protein